MNKFVLAIIALILSFGLTFLIRRLALLNKVLDIPNERSSHSAPTPRGGGLAIVIVWFLALGYLYFRGEMNESLFFALSSGCILALVSLLDDLLSIRPFFRLLIQTATAVLALYFMGGTDLLAIGEHTSLILQILAFILAVLGIVWFINLFNFMDGINGYASLETIFIAVGLFIFTGSMPVLILMAATLGFLLWNWPRAKIFMGDVGSTQLGFILVVLGLNFHKQQEVNILFWAMLSSLFWFDATLTLIRRWIRREKLSQAHKKHAYQRIVQYGFSHLKTGLFALGVNIVILFLVFLANKSSALMIPALAANLLLLTLVMYLVERKFPFGKA